MTPGRASATIVPPPEVPTLTLQERLQDELKQAMRDRDEMRKSVIRFARAAIRDREIEKRVDLDDEGVLDVLSRQAQQRRDSIEAFQSAGRTDLVEKETAELAIIQEYLPKQMSAEEITELAKAAISETGASGPSDMGKVMGRLMPQCKGRAPGKQVSSIVQELLRS